MSLANCGHPDATFISLWGRWNEEFSGVGLKVCTMCRRWFWSTRMRETLLSKGHFSRGSYSPLIRTKNTDKWVPSPMPSPFRYALIHILYPFLHWKIEHAQITMVVSSIHNHDIIFLHIEQSKDIRKVYLSAFLYLVDGLGIAVLLSGKTSGKG